jgi:hypothetical protein
MAAACGKEVSISNSKLQSKSILVENGFTKGTLIRGAEDKIIIAGRSYKVSEYSSNQATAFINGQPMNIEIPVELKGVVTSEVRLVEIKKLP